MRPEASNPARPARRLRAAALATLCLAVSVAAWAQPPDEAWRLLESARQGLVDQELEADFVQTFVPAGFSTGDTESGVAAFGLPERLRWDYATPFPRTFVLRGLAVFTWNPGEATGRRFALDAEEARHLELLRLDVDRLSARYRAVLEPPDGDRRVVALEPLDAESRIIGARIELDPETDRPATLSYRDREGNETRFDLSGYRPLADPGRFAPPEDLTWIDS